MQVFARRSLGSAVARKTALIVGATGAVGTAFATEFASRAEGWAVLGIARNPPANPIRNVSYLQCDLGDPEACANALVASPPVTHVLYCARVTHSEQPVESISENLRLLENVVNAAEASSTELEHVHLVQGGKYYGVHLGPFPTPAREGRGRCSPPNFNHAQQDLLVERSAAAPWNWSACRPNTLLHYSPHIARNIVSTLGVFVAICAEDGLPLDFPGPVGAYSSLTQVTSLDVLASTVRKMVKEPGCANLAFNVTNTDVFRWSAIWTGLAERFGVPIGSVQPRLLADSMQGREAVWRRVCERHCLRPRPLSEVANWPFADATLERHWDEILSRNRARRHGLDSWDDSESRFFRILDQYRQAHILP